VDAAVHRRDVKLARSLLAAGEPKETIAELSIPAPFDSWEQSMFFAPNLHFLYQRLSLEA